MGSAGTPIKIFDWNKYVHKNYERITVPEPYPILGHIKVDKMVERVKTIKDPLLGLISTWDQDEYSAAKWTKEAYTKMFEKFTYAKPAKIAETYEDLWDFATKMVLDEYSYMQNATILDITSTTKNMESTPAFPKMQLYDTEAAYIATEGWSEYRDLWNNPKRGRVLWWTFLKNEIIKNEKIRSNDIRMIMCTDPCFTRFGAAFDQHQNEMMKLRTETNQAQVGWTPFFGGLNKRLQRLSSKGDTFVELDWTRFDGTIPVELFSHIKAIRWFFHAERLKTPENKERYDWYVENLINKITLLPTGEITLIRGGNPSGQISTTTDNNMVNTFLTAFEIGYMFKKKYGRAPTVLEYRSNVDSICYGDDRVLAYNSSWIDYNVNDVPGMYREIFGMWVKPEKIKKSSKLEGLSFCGMVFVQHKGEFFGVPTVNKILASLEEPTRKLPDIQSLWGKLTSLRILTEYSSQEVNDFLEEQIQRVREYAQTENIELPEVPSYFYRSVWTGGPK
nr:MAG: nonstructural protein [Avian astrovirus 4]